MKEREIKFRFFCPAANCFVKKYNYNGAVDELFDEDPTLIPSQYTGEKDSHGKEIWEDDIIQFKRINFNKPFKAIIKYKNGSFFAEVFEPAGTISFLYLHVLKTYSIEYIVIGNKYQNLETIKQ